MNKYLTFEATYVDEEAKTCNLVRITVVDLDYFISSKPDDYIFCNIQSNKENGEWRQDEVKKSDLHNFKIVQ